MIVVVISPLHHNHLSEHNIPRKRMTFRNGRSWNVRSLLKTARTPTPGWRMMELFDSGSLSPYLVAMNFMHTGEGTWSVWLVEVSLPELGSILKTTMLLVS
jgi:hypothetical protein